MTLDPHANHDVLHHLIYGWEGFVRLLANMTNRGAKISDKDLERLEKANQQMTAVIEKQRQG